MKTHTIDFKNKLKTFGRELTGTIAYTNYPSMFLTEDELNSISVHYEGGLLKSVMKQLDIDSNEEIPVGTEITYYFGLKVGNYYTNLNMGNYIVKDVEKKEDTNSYKITCYDKLLLSMIDYTGIGITYPITIRNYISSICTYLGLTFANSSDTFANYDKEIPNELYLDADGNSIGYTFRDVFDELAQVTASTICINKNDKLEIRYITETNDTINEEFLKNINVNFGEKYGPINTIVLSRSAGSDNIYYPATLPANPCEIKIKDNQIMNGNDRDTYLPAIYNVLNGLEYYINDFSSTGVVYYDLCDRYSVSIGNKTYSCVMFNDEINVTQGLEENIYTEMSEEAVTDYKKADKTDRKINQTTLIVDKQEGTITGLVTTVNNNYQEVLTKFDDYVPQSQFATVENTVTQLQTDTYTKTQIDTKLIDGSVTKVMSTAGTFDSDGLTIEKTDAKTKGNFNETGITVMDATGSTNTELLFAGYDNNLNETIVRTRNINVSKYLTIGNNSRIEDYENGTGVFYVGG